MCKNNVNTKLAKNPFWVGNSDDEEIDFCIEDNPYQDTSVLETIVSRVSPNIVQPEIPVKKYTVNPYEGIWSFQERTGQILAFAGIPSSLRESYKRQITMLVGRRIGIHFSEELDGLYFIPMAGQEIAGPKKICNFYFEIVELRKTHARNGTFVIEIVYVVNKHTGNKLSIAKGEYGNIIDKILKVYPDCCLNPGFGKDQKAYLKEYGMEIYALAEKEINLKEYYTFHGWHEVAGEMQYLSSSRDDCICECFVPKIEGKSIIDAWHKGLHILDIGKTIYGGSGQVDTVESIKVSLPFFLYLHLGFCASLFQDLAQNVQFLLLLVGQSGSLKTAICKAFAEPFNTEKMLRFESTPRSIELYRDASVDMTMIVDDIFAKNKEVLEKFENVLRAFGDEISRAKSDTSFNKIERSQVRGGCIVTAEHNLDSQQSSALRYLQVDLDRNSIDGNILREFQMNQKDADLNKKFSWVQAYFAAWIDYLQNNYKDIRASLIDFEPPKVVFKNKRHQTIYWILNAVSKMILQWGISIGTLSEQEKNEKYLLWNTVIHQVLLKNEAMASVAEPYQQFLEALKQAIGTGTAILANSRACYEAAGHRYIGYMRTSKGQREYVMAPNKTIVLIRKLMLEMGKNLTANDSSVFKHLYENGISLGYQNQGEKGKVRHRYFRRIKLNDQLVEMLVIPVNVMVKKIEEMYHQEEML